MNCGKKIPDTLILVIYLPPAMLFFSFFKKIPDMLILVIYLPPAVLFLISQKIPDMLILVLYLPLTMPLWVVSKNLDTIFPHIVSGETTFVLHLEIKRSQYISPKVTVHKGVETIQGRKLFKGGNYEEIRYTDFSPYYLTHREVACIFVWTQALPVDLRS